MDLTWDETDVNRQEIVRSMYNGKTDESVVKKYLACSSSEDEDENDLIEDTKGKKKKNLLVFYVF